MTGRPGRRLERRGRRTALILALALIPALTLALLATPPAPAAPLGQRYTFASYELDVRVDANTALRVQDRVTYRFNGPGEWVGIYVPFQYGIVAAPRVLDEHGQPLPDGQQEIEWGDEGVTLRYNGEGSAGETKVIYDYSLYEALDRRGDAVGLDWSATLVTHASPIERSTVTIHLPGQVGPSDLDLRVQAYNYDGLVSAERLDGETVRCSSGDIPPDAYYRFSCYWPASIMGEEAAPPPGSASGRRWEFARFDTDIRVNPDASLSIKETQVVDFSGSFSFLNRDITTASASNHDGTTYGRVRISDVAVYDLDGNPYDGSRWRVEDISGGRRVRIEFEARDERKGWIIEYRMSGAMIYYDEYDRLYFNSVSYDREVPIAASRTTVRLPDGVDMEQVDTTMYVDRGSPPAAYDYGQDGDTLWWTAEGIAPHTVYTIDVAFPKGVVAVPWQFRPAFKLAMAALAALLFLACLACMLWLWARRGRDVGRTGTRMVRYDPPPGVKPAVIGMLLREEPRVKDISATIVDLARRGFLTIFEDRRGHILNRVSFGFQKRAGGREGLNAYEEEVMDGLFASGDRVTEKDLKNSFYTHVPTILGGVTDEALELELFPADPASVKRRYTGSGALVCGASVSLFLLLNHWWDLGWAWLLLPSLLLSGLAVMVVGRAMPRRTAKGSQAYEHALGFKEYLATAEKEEVASMTAENFQETLPYAMVLGVAEAWAAKFADIFTEPPDWFEGAGAYSTAYLAFRLNGMYDNLGSTLTSSPGGSGGSSGGFGGGSSGGGFGGGGSSAG